MNAKADNFASRAYISGSDLMVKFGYSSRAAFWEFVRRSGVPHIRLSQRKIIFEEAALADWLNQRSSHPV